VEYVKSVHRPVEHDMRNSIKHKCLVQDWNLITGVCYRSTNSAIVGQCQDRYSFLTNDV